MSKETKVNLIALVVLGVLLAPGAIILFNKKLDPEAAPMYLPSVLPPAFAYNDPWERPPHISRIIPRETGQWVRGVAEERMEGDRQVPIQWLSGAVSRGRGFELAAVATVPEGYEVGLLVWRLEGDPVPEDWKVEVSTLEPVSVGMPKLGEPGIRVNGRLIEPLEVALYRTSMTVREELRDMGMLEPHTQARWVKLFIPGDEWDGRSVLSVRFGSTQSSVIDVGRFEVGR